jgi:hypothetical protein
MDSLAKRILYIDLNRGTSEVKLETALKKYVGGIGVGLKILSEYIEEDPVIFSVGPLSGFFPFCSKTSVVTNDNSIIEDLYIGGALSSRIKFAGLDSIVITGKAKNPLTLDIQNESVAFKPADTELGSLGLPGKKSTLSFDKEQEAFLVDKYFAPPEKILENKLLDKNLLSIVVTGSKTFDLKDPEKYGELFKKVLKQTELITVNEGSGPSCVGCPMGCRKSKNGEIGGNVLTHSLVACTYAEKIFSDVGITFSCLNYLGYDYTHEDIENLPQLINNVIKELN